MSAIQVSTFHREAPARESLRIAFVCQNDFGAPSEKQVLAFAQQLTGLGHEVLIAIAGESREGADGLAVHRYGFARGRLRGGDVRVLRTFAPDLVHAWNSRVCTVAAAAALCEATGAPLFVHFEDDEWRLPAIAPGERLRRGAGQLARRALSVVDPSVWWHSTRRSRHYVARRAVALDALTPVLADEVERRMGRECRVVLPVTPSIQASTRAPRLPVDAPTLLITGTIWPVYLPDFVLGFQAVAELQRRGRSVRLVHAGRVLPRWDPQRLAAQAGVVPGTATFLGYLPYAAIPGLLREADVLLQPGPPSEFNRLRLPSKLQAYLESGTPTITFAVGFGELLEDRLEVLKTYTADPCELADRIEEGLDDEALRAQLAAGGPRAAARLFDPVANTESLLAHYREGLACRSALR